MRSPILFASVLLMSEQVSTQSFNYNNMGNDWTSGSCSTVSFEIYPKGDDSVAHRYHNRKYDLLLTKHFCRS